MFDLIGESIVKSVINSLTGGQKIKLEFDPPIGKIFIHHKKLDGTNQTFEITFEKAKEMINK